MDNIRSESEDQVNNFLTKIYSGTQNNLLLNIDSKEVTYELRTGIKKELKLEQIDIELQNSECIGLIIKDMTLMKREERNKLSNEFQNRLVRTISHEIRTPLNAIQGSIELIEHSLDPQILIENDLYFRTIKNGIRFLIYFVDGILELSRFRSEEKDIRFEMNPFNIFEMVEDVVSLFGVEMVRKPQVKMLINIHNDTPNVIIHDINALTQLIFALLSNSVKYKSRGQIMIEIMYNYNEELKIIISDSGIGINDEQKNHLFQLYGEALHSEFGMGIGLTLCKNITESMGGSIQLESAECIGTKVTIQFPCMSPLSSLAPSSGCQDENEVIKSTFSSNDEGDIHNISEYISGKARLEVDDLSVSRRILEEEKSEEAPMALRISRERNRHGKCECAQILIVDDMNSNILVLRGLLGLLGLKADDAKDGLDAIKKIKISKERKCCGNYQTILMDCNMPLMNGYEATQQIVHLIHNGVV